MANTYKNIVITPNRSSNTADPKVVYSGGNTTANTDITLNVYPDSNGTLSWEGSAGQLFSITNDLSNNIFGVNDVSGIPSLEIYANSLVSIAPFGGNVVIGNTAEFILSPGTGLHANGSFGTAGQVLHTNGSAVYWAADDNAGGTVTSVATGSGLTGGTITATGTVSVLANNGITANTTGLFVTQGTGTVVNSSGVHVTNVPNAITFNNGGAGAASGSTYTGSSTLTVSYNTVGAPSTSGTNASGTWSININGSAASATNASAATNATTATSATNATTQSTTGSTNFSVGTLVYSANTQGGRTYETHDFNSYPNLYSTMFINPTGSTNVPAGFSGNGYRFIMGAGDTTTRGFDLLGSSAPALWFRAREQGTWNQVVYNSGTWSININGTAGSAPNPNAVTFNNGGAGAASGSTYTGSATLTVSYNTVGAPSTTGTNASGTWSISINGSAASATNASAATNATTATNWGTYGAVPAAGSSGGTASTIPRSDVNGYTYFGYINSSTGNSENPAVSQVIVTNGTDNFYRKSAIANFTTYLSGTASSLTAGAATNASFATNATSATNASYQGPTGTSNDWVTSFQNTPAHYTSFREMSANGPSGTWWFMENMRHSNGTNYWGRQNAWGWEDNANEYYSRNISGGTFGSWVRFLNSSNYNSYSPTLTGTGASGTWSININGSAASATNASAATNATNATNLGGVASSSYLRRDSTAAITAGYTLTPGNLGTISTGTTTLNPATANYQYYTNGGAHTIAAPSSDCAIDVLVTNSATAGAITLSGFTAPSGGGGDSYATTNGNRYILIVRRINGVSTYSWKALQ